MKNGGDLWGGKHPQHLDFVMPTLALARRTDPETSHQAAARVNVTKREQVVLDALDEYGPMTSEELAAATGTEIPAITPRFRPLANKGLIVEARNQDGEIITRRGASGRKRIVWRLA